MKETFQNVGENETIKVFNVEATDAPADVVAQVAKLEPDNWNIVFLVMAYGKKTRQIEITGCRGVDPKKGWLVYLVKHVDAAGNPSSEWSYVQPAKILAFGTYDTVSAEEPEQKKEAAPAPAKPDEASATLDVLLRNMQPNNEYPLDWFAGKDNNRKTVIRKLNDLVRAGKLTKPRKAVFALAQ